MDGVFVKKIIKKSEKEDWLIMTNLLLQYHLRKRKYHTKYHTDTGRPCKYKLSLWVRFPSAALRNIEKST